MMRKTAEFLMILGLCAWMVQIGFWALHGIWLPLSFLDLMAQGGWGVPLLPWLGLGKALSWLLDRDLGLSLMVAGTLVFALGVPVARVAERLRRSQEARERRVVLSRVAAHREATDPFQRGQP